MSKISITNDIRSILLADADIQAMIDTRIFPLFAPKDTTGDFILYKRDEYNLERTKMGIAREKCKVYLNIVSDDYDNAQRLAELAYSALEGSHQEYGITVELTDSTEDTQDDKYIQILLFSIK